MLLVNPIGNAYGSGYLSVKVPTNGCITDEMILMVKAISPSWVKVSPIERSKIGNIAGTTACNESFNKWQAAIINKI